MKKTEDLFIGALKEIKYIWSRNQILSKFTSLPVDLELDNVKNNQIANLNLMVGYWKNYGYYKNTFIVLAAMSENSKGSLNEIPISVKSSKFGVFLKGKPKNNPFSKIQQRILFTKEIEINNDFEIIDKIYDDVITVTIGDQNYKFLNPELELK